jgi:DNA invertase Pin-like site-specific DNA recombinase/DNA-binding CsgD family transcriptional regulator
MLDRTYDPSQPYRYARYARMSSTRQNKRSPDQQFTTIDETIARCGYPWQCVATYRDDGISGRYLRKRPDFQKLLRDIEARLIRIDLLVVDSLERLGRAEEIAELRRKLFVEYGVLVVAADNAYADPTGVVGKAVGLVEQLRSTENTRISRHNILRGKKDAARRGRWPGGPAPFGFRLKRVIDDGESPTGTYHTLEPEARAAAALRLAFARAAATGEGDLRLARWWNSTPEIPDDAKPISPFTMGYRLSNPIAVGTLRWGANRTGVVNDTRVVEANPDGAELIRGFCPAIVSVELFDRVQQVRRLRGARIKELRQAPEADDPPKLIAPQAPGLTLKYLLTGLVRCAVCQASMRPVPSGRRSKSGRRYTYYSCPRHYDGACSNGRHVPEDQLRAAVIARLRARLFPAPGQTEAAPAWLPEVLAQVRQEQQRYQEDEPDQDAADREELRQVEQQLTGWVMTLAKPALPAAVRTDVEARYAQGKERQQVLRQQMAARQTLRQHLDHALDPQAVLAALARLDQVLAEYNPTLANLELAKHIDVIACWPDGRVELRGTMLGLFAGAADLLRRGDDGPAAAPQDPGGVTPVVPRRRGRLRVPNLSAEGKGLTEDVDPALDPERFAGLPEGFFWNDVILMEQQPCWSQEHAVEVARERAAGKTHEQLADQFEVSVPTIRKAIRIARKGNEEFSSLPRKMPRPRWPERHFREVAEMARQGVSLKELCRQFKRSEPLIREALGLAEEHARREKDTAEREETNPPPDLPHAES